MVPLPVAPDPPLRPLPLLGRLVPAGFPSPADDHLEGEIDLNEYLVRRPAATYSMRVSGHSMTGAGILHGDLVVVDRSLEPVPGHVVVAVVGGEMIIKRLRRTRQGRTLLLAEHPDYPPVAVAEGDGDGDAVEIWGVVVGVARRTA